MKLSSTRWEPQSLAFWAALCKVYAHHHHGQAVPNMRWARALGRERDRLRGSTVRTGSAHWGLPGAQAEPTPWQGLPAQREMQGAPSCLDLTCTCREASSKCVVPVHSQEQGDPGDMREAEQDDSLSLHSSHALVMLLVAVWTAQAVMLRFFYHPCCATHDLCKAAPLHGSSPQRVPLGWVDSHWRSPCSQGLSHS